MNAERPKIDQEEMKFLFSVFNEIGIINQLTRSLFEQTLPEKLTVPHFSVLNHLVRLGDGVSPLQLANAFQVPKATMTNTLQGLQQRELIKLLINPDDGRSKLVYLTTKGRTFREEAISSLIPDMQLLSSQFDTAKLRPMLPVLQELREILDKSRN